MAENTGEKPRTDADAGSVVSRVRVRPSLSGTDDALRIEALFTLIRPPSGSGDASPDGRVDGVAGARGALAGLGEGLSRGPRPSPDEVLRAFEVLLRDAAARAPEAFDRAVDALVDHVEVRDDRRRQAWLHAELRQGVLDTVELLSPREMARLLPHVVGGDSNIARALDRARARGDLLAVPCRNSWRYPAEQVGPRGEVHEGLGDAVRRATAAGYGPWEITDWFAHPIDAPAAPARALAGHERSLDVDEVFALASADAPSAPAELGPSPFELLALEDTRGFEDALDAWLG